MHFLFGLLFFVLSINGRWFSMTVYETESISVYYNAVYLLTNVINKFK